MDFVNFQFSIEIEKEQESARELQHFDRRCENYFVAEVGILNYLKSLVVNESGNVGVFHLFNPSFR